MSTRGIRNNNPANIRRGCCWKGLVEWPTDKAFCQFTTMTWGIRALLVTLHSYVVVHGKHTIPQIIERWAPPQDGNNTKRYIQFVEDAVKEIDAPIRLSLQAIDFRPEYQHPKSLLYLIAKAMCKMESGYNLEYDVYISAIHLMW